MNKNFNRNLILGFSISMLLLLVSSVASFISIRGLIKSSGWVEHTNVVIRKLEATLSSITNAEASQRGYLLTGDSQFLATYREASNNTTELLSNLKSMSAGNSYQQQNILLLDTLIAQRRRQLQHVVELRQAGHMDLLAELDKGSNQMQLVLSQAEKIKQADEALLAQRKESLNSFARASPFVIISSGLLALLITVFFYVRIRKDFASRMQLQNELVAKDKEITHRINIIQQIANRISQRDYAVRTEDIGADGLGRVSVSLNRMAASLDDSFRKLSDKEWLQTGVASLNQEMLNESELGRLVSKIIRFITTYTGGQAGALYLMGADNLLHLEGSYALAGLLERRSIQPGDGPAGEAFRSNTLISISDVPDGLHTISHAGGALRPKHLIAFPILNDGRPSGVIELSFLHDISQNTLQLLHMINHQIGIVISNTQSRVRIQQMLEEAQAQAEELQAQHGELENMNTELEAQSQKLQASEEELRVQQEELMQANQELEERAHLLEERNTVIAQRNIDIQQKAEELAQSTKYKSEFLANMSHELRTPLNSILLLSRLMAENSHQNLTPDQVEYAQVIQSSGNGLLALIDEILDLSKIEAGKMELEYGTITLNEVVSDMQGLFRVLAKERGLVFNTAIAEGTPAIMETDKMRLEQILRNLLSNAFKFTAAGSVSLSISEGGPGMLRFSVKDTGIGIAPEKQSLIFEAFRQEDGSTHRKYGGTGLGLSISRELSKLLGGNLTLSSKQGEGAEFVLEIPGSKAVAQATGTKAGDTPKEIVQDPIAPVPVPPGAPAGRRFLSLNIPEPVPDDRHAVQESDKLVLIIEDDSGFAKALLDYTRNQGYKGVVAGRGDEGLELAQSLKPTAILLDIELPVKDGWEIMEALKADPQTRHIPVHIMSSHAMKKEGMQRGAVDFINKPFSFEQMQEVFAKLERPLNTEGKKVLIVEENPRHAQALSHFLETFNINSEIADSVDGGIRLLQKKEVDCVILDMGIPDKAAYDTLDSVKKNPALEDIPIIIFTGKSLSQAEEKRIRKYADSIVIKTAHSYKRMLDEVSLFLHLMEESRKADQRGPVKQQKIGVLNNILMGKTILVADDDVRNIFSLTKSLEQHGVHVIPAMDGREALRILEENTQVDLVLMDMMMPEMDGYESTARIRQQHATRNLPVIAVTAKTMTGDRQKCIEAGASDYISKPVDIDQLLSLLRVWLYERSA
jgi:CheY-like chemotaxis protein